MKVESMIAARPARHGERLPGSLRALAAAAALALAAHGAGAAAAPDGQSPGVKLEKIPGSSVARVTLAPRAAERLGIQTAKVSEEAVVRKQMVGGLIIPPMEKLPEPKPAGGEFSGFGRAPAPAKPGAAPVPKAAPAGAPAAKVGAAPAPNKGGLGFGRYAVAAEVAPRQPPAAEVALPAAAPPPSEVWVLVTLSPGEWERLAKDKPARLLQLATRDKAGKVVLAQPSGFPPLEDAKRSMLSVYYTIPGLDHGLAVNNRVRVELQMAGSEEKQKVVPYGAVYYDAKGAAWVYANPRPLTFERRPVTVDRVVGDQAILAEGPPAGTPVVTVGAALLYGAEIFKK